MTTIQHDWYAKRERERQRYQQTLERGLAEWANSKTLLNEKQINNIYEWLPLDSLPPASRELLEKSEAAHRSHHRQRLLLRCIAIAFIFLSICFIGFYAIKVNETALAHQQLQTEMQKTLRVQSLFLADLAQQQTQQGNATNGMLLALEALPKSLQTPERAYTASAEQQLYAVTVSPRGVRL